VGDAVSQRSLLTAADMTSPDVRSIVDSAGMRRKLQLRTDLHEPGWTFWELRTLNVQRVVGFLTEHRQFADARDLEAGIREIISRHFKRSWWRGMALGVVAEVRAISLSADDLKLLVDIRENASGTLQWVILVESQARVALGVHTWMETYLSPVYRGTLRALAETGYQVASAMRDKNDLLESLTGVADMNAALRSFRTRREALPRFREP
jgi:hypothetical protein